MKKILIFLFILLPITLLNFNVLGAFYEDTEDSIWTYNTSLFYHNSSDLNEGLGIGFDLGGGTSTYYDGTYVDWKIFFENINQIRLSAYNTSGNYNTTDYFEFIIDFSYDYFNELLTIDLYGSTDNYLSGALVLLDSDVVSATYDDLPLFYVGFDGMSSSQSSVENDNSISLRVGKNPVDLTWTNTNFEFYDGGLIWDNNATYRLGIKLLTNTTSIYNPYNLVYGADTFISNLIAINTNYIGRVELYAFNEGYQQAVLDGQQVSLLDLFNTVIGWLVSFVLFFFNLSVFGISLLDILSIGVLVIGLLWLLKLIRG
jgi:hypothetical protein